MEESNPVEKQLEESIGNDVPNDIDSIEESHLTEESIETSSSEDLSTQEDTVKED